MTTEMNPTGTVSYEDYPCRCGNGSCSCIGDCTCPSGCTCGSCS